MQQITTFEHRFGFPRHAVTLSNWRQPPFSRWAFQNVAELVPTALSLPVADQPESAAVDPAALLDLKLDLPERSQTLRAYLERSHTDAFCVMKAGRFVADWQAAHMAFGAGHLVFSVSKSLTGILCGVLEEEGVLDPQAPVTRYIPEAAGSAFAKARVRDLLDMSVSLDFDEAYQDPEGLFPRYRQAMLWNPGTGSETLAQFLYALRPLPGPHGAVFRYCSPNSDLLGLVIERAAGDRIPDLMRDRLWHPMGLRGVITTTVDAEGSARTAGGISLTARDLARIGEMMRQGGVANGRQIVPESWVDETTCTGGSRDAWVRGSFLSLLPEGRYRNQWYQSGKGYFCAIGIHGQWLMVDPASELVMVKMSSQPVPSDDNADLEAIAVFEALTRLL